MSENILAVTVQTGENFPKLDLFDETDPFVILKLEGSKKEFRSSTKNNAGESPQWLETFQFSHVADEGKLSITAYDEDTLTAHDLIGKAEIDIKPFANKPGEPHEAWYELKGGPAGRNKTAAIRIKLTITMIRAGNPYPYIKNVTLVHGHSKLLS